MAKAGIKELILAEARQSFARFGYKRTVIDDIVRAVGISKGAFYLHFESKEALFRAVIIDLRQKIMTEWMELFNREKTVLGKMRVTLKFTFDALEKHPIFARVSSNDPEFRLALGMTRDEAIQQEVESWKKYFGDLFRLGIETGELRPDLDPDVMPMVIGSLKLFHFHQEEIGMMDIEKERFIDSVIDLAINGIKNPNFDETNKEENETGDEL